MLRCWTQGKQDKLKYLRAASMWYLTDTCSPLEALIADNVVKNEKKQKVSLGPGEVYTFLQSISGKGSDEQWDLLSAKCCAMMPNAP